MEMQEFPRPRSRTIWKTVCLLAAVVAVGMIGGASWLLITNPEALFVFKNAIFRKSAGSAGNPLPTARPSEPKPEASAPRDPHATESQADLKPRTIPIGLSSISAVHYSRQSGSVRAVFELETANLVGKGTLGSPDRIYFDLQESGREQSPVGRLRGQKEIRIEADPVTGIRIAQHASGIVRIVLDLSRPCDFTHQTLPGSPSHLRVEVRPREGGASDAPLPTLRN